MQPLKLKTAPPRHAPGWRPEPAGPGLTSVDGTKKVSISGATGAAASGNRVWGLRVLSAIGKAGEALLSLLGPSGCPACGAGMDRFVDVELATSSVPYGLIRYRCRCCSQRWQEYTYPSDCDQ